MSHIIIELAVGKPDVWMQEKLESFIWVLDQNLRNNKLGHAEGKYYEGIITVKASGISLAETRSLVDTFTESMRNHGQRLIVSKVLKTVAINHPDLFELLLLHGQQVKAKWQPNGEIISSEIVRYCLCVIPV